VDLSDHLASIWRRKWVVLAGAVIITVAVYALRASANDVYRAEARLVVDVGAGPSAEAARPENLVFLLRTYAARADTQVMHEAAAEASGLGIDGDEVDDRTSVRASGSDATAIVTATGPTGADAAVLATVAADAIVARIEEEEREGRQERLDEIDALVDDAEAEVATAGEGTVRRTIAEQELAALLGARAALVAEPVGSLQVVAEAETPSSPVSPRPTRDAVLALIVALVVGAELAAAIDAVATRRRVV
jgi:non-specific protein-tyrosine kinase